MVICMCDAYVCCSPRARHGPDIRPTVTVGWTCSPGPDTPLVHEHRTSAQMDYWSDPTPNLLEHASLASCHLASCMLTGGPFVQSKLLSSCCWDASRRARSELGSSGGRASGIPSTPPSCVSRSRMLWMYLAPLLLPLATELSNFCVACCHVVNLAGQT